MEFLTKNILRKYLNAFLEKNATDKKTLNIGSGATQYRKYFPNLVTVDINKDAKPDFVADVHDLPFSDNEFESILSTEMLEHLHTPEKAVSEMYRVLKPGGKLVLTTRFVFPIHTVPNDYYRFTYFGMEHLFREFEIVELSAEAGVQTTLAILLQRVCYQTDMNRILKGILFLTAILLDKLPEPIRKEYGHIRRDEPLDTPFLTSGYHIICKKRA